MNPFSAIYCNNTKELKLYIDKNDINIRNEKEMSLLEYAIVFNNPDAFELLLDNYPKNKISIFKQFINKDKLT